MLVTIGGFQVSLDGKDNGGKCSFIYFQVNDKTWITNAEIGPVRTYETVNILRQGWTPGGTSPLPWTVNDGDVLKVGIRAPYSNCNFTVKNMKVTVLYD